MRPWNSIATTYVKAYQRVRKAWDTFSHDETDQWGSPETTLESQTWTTSGGTAANYSISGGTGNIALSTLNAARFVTTGSGIGDVELTASITVPAVITGDDCHAQLLARFVDTSNHYSALVSFGDGGNLALLLAKTVGGSFSTLASTGTLETYAAGATVNVRFQCYGTNVGASLKGRVWLSTDDEPDEWTLEDVVSNDPTLLLGGVGVRALLGAAVSNSLPVTLNFDGFTAFGAPAWLDITSEVLVAGSQIEASIGRQTELAAIEPSNMSFQLRNQSGWFTPDNIVSPYWPDWQTGVPIRWSETIGARSFAFPDMFLEIPEVSLTFEAADDPTRSDRLISMNCVDLLTKLNNAPRFTSNLGEFIKYNATSGALRAYWPLTDPSGSTYANSAGPIRQDPLRFERVDSYSSVDFAASLINLGAVDGPPGDDATAVEFTPRSSATWGRLSNDALSNSTPASSETATLVCWVYVPEEETTLAQVALWRDLETFDIFIRLGDPFAGGDWLATFSDALTGNVDVTLGRITTGWHLVGGQIDFSSGDVAFWVDTGEVLDNTGGLGTSDKSLDRVVLDGGFGDASGLRMAHLQCYIGDADAFTHDDFLAQWQAGYYTGFVQQTVDERIRTICNYAGFADSRLDLEESDSLMQDPAFAGRRPGDLAAAAAASGGGILFTQGDRLVYHDRKHRFGL